MNQVYRDLNNNFFVDGKPIDYATFKSIGINADFVPPGQTVSVQQAVTGRSQTQATDSVPDLPPEYQALYQQLDNYLKELQKRGQVINPNVVIDPAKLAEFTAQAKNEIDPYYANQLKVAKDQFLTSLGYSKEALEANETELERQYSQKLEGIASSAAEKGFAQSGIRQLDEQDLAQSTQYTLDTNRRQLGQNLASTASTFAGQYGTSNLPQSPLSHAPRVLAGESDFGRGQQSPFYSLSSAVYDGLRGTNEFQQTADVRNRASQLEGAYRSELANNQLRQLTL